MQRLDLAFPTPAEQLAADEALLDWCEAGHGGEMLTFWEPQETFVVVGYANKVATEVNVAACEARDVPIFRRCTGGGTVVQMPGGLNYSLILRITKNGPTRNISSANQFIMERNCAAVQTAIGGAGPMVSVRGHTDLAVLGDACSAGKHSTAEARPANNIQHSTSNNPHGNRRLPVGDTADYQSALHVERNGGSGVYPPTFLKVAGNSQRRRKHFLLFHGTFLLNCDLQLISELLRMPSLQPDYRASRAHGEFVTNLNLPAAVVKAALVQAWNVDGELANPPLEEIRKLAREKYEKHEWNYKF